MVAPGSTVWLRLNGPNRKSWPVPLKLTVCGLPLALSLTLSVPVRVPLAVGLKPTVIEHPDPAATDLPQLLVSLKSPLTVTLLIWRAAALLLVSVTF